MKKIANLITLRAGIATALCLSFLIYPPLRLSSATAVTAHAATDLKTESQYRSEASRYDGAIRAISGIATMTLETGDDLKKALALLDRERPNLKLHRSKYITLALSDSTFTAAVKKRAPDQTAAEALVKEIQADPKTVYKLDGTASLKRRIQRSAEEDAAILRRVSERLKEAAERIKKASQGRAAPGFYAADELKLSRVNFTSESQPVNATKTVTPPQVETVLAIIIATAVVATLAGYVVGRITNTDLEDDIADCQETFDKRYLRCVSAAGDLPSGFPFFQREAAIALCYSEWLALQALCVVAG